MLPSNSTRIENICYENPQLGFLLIKFEYVLLEQNECVYSSLRTHKTPTPYSYSFDDIHSRILATSFSVIKSENDDDCKLRILRLKTLSLFSLFECQVETQFQSNLAPPVVHLGLHPDE